MKINEMVKETGLSKRTIHYYIEENLITPKVNLTNGYYIFSVDDINKLKTIKQLRLAEFSISDIRCILKYPNTIHFYIQRQTEKLEEEYVLLGKKIECLNTLNNKLPLFVSYDNLSNHIENIIFPTQKPTLNISNNLNDSKLISLYLWGNFLYDLPMTEYRQFLWDKTLKTMANINDSNILLLKKYLYSLSASEIDKEFTKRNIHINEVCSINKSNYEEYVNKMKLQLYEIIKEPQHQLQWKNAYYSYFLPSICIFDSQVNQLMTELSPRFSTYSENIHECCELLYQWLYTEKGNSLRIELNDKLNNYINIKDYHHGQLAALANFSSL